MKECILVIDDIPAVLDVVQSVLERESYEVNTATDGSSALEQINIRMPDLILLDIMLPDKDGLAVCRKVRETSRIPIIMLTARGDVADRIVGLELGADDYLPKPFEPRELVARMQAVLRRGERREEEIVRAGPLEVNWARQSASLEGRPLALTTAEFELLGLLVRNRGRVLSRDRIMDAMKGIDAEAFDRSIDVLVSRVRQKLGDDAKQSTFIRTVRGVGYSFTGGTRD